MIYSFIPARPCSAGPRRIAWEVKPCFAASVRPCLKPVRLVPLLRDCADVVVTFSNTRKKFKKKKTLGYGFGARALSVRAGCGEGSDRNGYEKKKKVMIEKDVGRCTREREDSRANAVKASGPVRHDAAYDRVTSARFIVSSACEYAVARGPSSRVGVKITVFAAVRVRRPSK